MQGRNIDELISRLRTDLGIGAAVTKALERGIAVSQTHIDLANELLISELLSPITPQIDFDSVVKEYGKDAIGTLRNVRKLERTNHPSAGYVLSTGIELAVAYGRFDVAYDAAVKRGYIPGENAPIPKKHPINKNFPGLLGIEPYRISMGTNPIYTLGILFYEATGRFNKTARLERVRRDNEMAETYQCLHRILR